MKIAVIGPVYPFRGGIAHFTSVFSERMAAQQNEVKIFSFKRQYPKWLYPGETDQDPSLEPIRADAVYSLDPMYPWTWLDTARQIRQFSPDLLTIHWWTTFWGPAYAGLVFLLHTMKTHYPVAYIIHNTLPHEQKFWDPWIARLALRQGDHFLAQTEKQAERLRSLIPAVKVQVVPHPIYDMFSHQHISPIDARRQLRLVADAKVILFFGIVRAYKGLKVLLNALVSLRAQEPQIHLVIAGEFWESVSEYQNLILTLGLADCVTIDNRYIPNEDVPLYFSAADVFVAPYISGTQSGVVKLALGFGLPVVVTDVVADDMLRGRADVVIIPADRSDLLSAAIFQLLSSSSCPSSVPEQDTGWADLVHAVEIMKP